MTSLQIGDLPNFFDRYILLSSDNIIIAGSINSTVFENMLQAINPPINCDLLVQR
jgi:hypothetical protein